MTKTKIKQEDYEISYSGGDLYVLEYMPGVWGEEGAAIKVSKIVYDYVAENTISLRELYDMFDLLDNGVFYKIGKPVKISAEKISEFDRTHNVIHRGLCFYVTDESDGYYFHNQLSRNGAGTGRFKIDEKILEYSKTEGVSVSEIFDKFDLEYEQ